MSESRAIDAAELSRCDIEPIHIPGSVQPHGVLLVIDELDLAVTQISGNCEALLGASAQKLLGSSLGDWLDQASRSELADALSRPRVEYSNPLKLRVAARNFDGICHRQMGRTILELEPVVQSSGLLSRSLRGALGRIQGCETLEALHQTTTREVSRLTGFDRVMIYRFDQAGHGSVIAETCDESFTPYLGQHYPASDIPLQARALYLLNWLRIIPDAGYVPSPIVSARPRADDPALDLSYAALRSVSPIHLEYMRNMGATASMSVSLVTHGRLWGLIGCVHHRGPRYVGYEDRAACEVIGRLASLQTEAIEELDRRRFREGRRAPLDTLEGGMRAARAATVFALAEHPTALLELVGAAGAALWSDDTLHMVGLHPSAEQIDDLLRWLDDQESAPLFSTACLSALYPPAGAWAEQASGLLCISLPGKPTRRVLWFRPEVIQTVHWSGDPNKAVELDQSARLQPRTSFALWKEELRARSLPWTPGELEAALELRRRAVELDLVKQVQLGEQAVRARDDLVAVVSHDLKNPLNVIQMQSSLMLRGLATTDEEPSRRMLAAAERIQRAIDRMNTLIHDLLDLSKIEAGRFQVQAARQDARTMVEEALVVLEPLGQQKELTMTLTHGEDCAVLADRDRIYQVLSNLVGNAVRFAPQGGMIRLSVSRVEDEVLFTVSDEGPGIAADQLPFLFNRYWQAPRSGRQGSGLGLFIAKGIVEAHGGRMWVDSKIGFGAAFSFSVPSAP